MNQKTRMIVTAIGTVAALALSGGPAMASGGNPSAGGGSGGGGGTTTSAQCSISSFSNSTGYYSVYAAIWIWTKFGISTSCGYAVNWRMDYTNGTTGAVDFSRSSSTAYMPGGTLDEDWAAFSTPYTVTLTVTDTSGAVIDSRSGVVTTKAGKSLTGA